MLRAKRRSLLYYNRSVKFTVRAEVKPGHASHYENTFDRTCSSIADTLLEAAQVNHSVFPCTLVE